MYYNKQGQKYQQLSIIKYSFDALKFYLPTTETTDNMTQDMLPVCEIQDKGKGPYTEISTLLSE